MTAPIDRPSGAARLRLLLIVVGTWGLIAAVAALLDAPTFVRAPLTLPFLLLGPGLAATAFFAPMRIGTRVMFASVFSTVVTIAIAGLFLWAGFWSGALVVATMAIVTQLIVVAALWSASGTPPGEPLATSTDSTGGTPTVPPPPPRFPIPTPPAIEPTSTPPADTQHTEIPR